MNETKKVAVINDIAGISRCSSTVAAPILSILGLHCCVLPTAILTNHTGYDEFKFVDFTNHMNEYIEMWSKLNVEFSAIYSGFLGSDTQISIVSNFIDKFGEKSLKLVDPVMGDNGEIYSTYTKSMCNKMKKLIKKADIITPNVTEGCILTNTEYTGENLSDHKAILLAKKLCDMGPSISIITGIHTNDNKIKIVSYDKEKNKHFIYNSLRTNINFPGTGDIFSSLICGYLLNDLSINDAIKKTADFIYRVSDYTIMQGTPQIESIQYEKFLREIII